MKKSLKHLIFSASIALMFNGAYAQQSPAQTKPISFVVGYAAGGSADYVARIVSVEMGKVLGRSVIVENVAGASGMMAVQKVLAAPADGQYLYMGGTDTVAVPLVNKKVKLDWEKDLTPVGKMTSVPMIFAVSQKSPYSTIPELIAGIKKSGADSFNYATPGIGTMQHFYGSLISQNAKVSMIHVPYKGGSQIATDLVGNQVDSAVLVLSTAMPFLKDGKIKALSVSGQQRAPQLPNVKRIGEELGFNNVSLPLWQGLFVKAGTDAAIVAAYEKAMITVLNMPEVKSKLLEAGITAAPQAGKEFRDFILPQVTIYKEIVNAAKITLD